MDLKLFASTFALIFLAELGDKTQLAALASSAGSKSPWSVFAGASAALVCSTLVAVLFGSTLQKYLPPHYLKGGAAVLFFVFGILLLISALSAPQAAQAPVPEREIAAEVKPGLLASLALRAAAQFEQASAADYRSLASHVSDSALKELFLHLADEERAHLDNMTAFADHHEAARSQPVGTHPDLPIEVGTESDRSAEEIVAKAIRHEYDTARFYEALAQTVTIPSVRTAIARCAEEERSHAQHLEHYAETGRFVGHDSRG